MPSRHILTSRVALGLVFAAAGFPTNNARSAEPVLQPVPEPPTIPERVQSGEVLEPDVTIIQRGDVTLHEYRVGGRLFAVRVFPKNAPPYYLVDTDGDGDLETRRSALSSEIVIPQWVLFSW